MPPGPYGILYVLLVSRCGRTEGRYQAPAPVDAQGLTAFLADFEDYLEGDGRHHQQSYQPEFDADDDRIMRYWDWVRFPLHESDLE